MALCRMVERGEVPSGAPVLVLGFGAGLTYAGQVLTCP
jgi:3-oxoacyl-[acyl-carrier-protein] synthase-3